MEKEGILPTEKLIICEIAFCGLATRSVNIIIEGRPTATTVETVKRPKEMRDGYYANDHYIHS
jgi:hypothetical protein